jgi:nucleotide-binding universal stress UspA family protein
MSNGHAAPIARRGSPYPAQAQGSEEKRAAPGNLSPSPVVQSSAAGQRAPRRWYGRCSDRRGEAAVNVLLAIDESSHSKAAVAAVRDRFQPGTAIIRAMHVVEWPRNLPASFSFAEGPSAADCILAAHEAMCHEGRDLVADVVSRLREAGFTATPVLAEGDVRQAILDEAAAWPADLIVLGSHGRTGLTRLLLGSVSETIVRHAPCSVEIVRAPHPAAAPRQVPATS